MEGYSPIQPEEPQADPGSRDGTSDDMEVGDLELDRMEVACSDQEPAKISPQQVSLLEKAIIQAKNANNLGFITEALKVTDGKGKNSKKDKRGILRNVQRIKAIGEQLVASGKYPTIDAALSPPN